MLFAVCAAAALIPLLVGFIWYHPKVLGKVWQQASGVTDEQIKGGKMAVIFGVSYIFAFLLAMAIAGMVIHQQAIQQLLFSFGPDAWQDPSTEAGAFYLEAKALVGNVHRTFGHGALHGAIGGFFTALPLLGTNALFERKGFKYIAINSGYWIIVMTLMGGVICQFAPGMP